MTGWDDISCLRDQLKAHPLLGDLSLLTCHGSMTTSEQLEALAADVQPLLSEVRDSALIKDVETITKSLAEATKDFRRLQSLVLIPDNSDLIRQSIYSLIFTLKNIESISSDISGFPGDEATRKNIKLLIKSLGRLL